MEPEARLAAASGRCRDAFRLHAAGLIVIFKSLVPLVACLSGRACHPKLLQREFDAGRQVTPGASLILVDHRAIREIRPLIVKRAILVGERYRHRECGQFARPALDWIVEAVYTGTDGIGHAKLVCASDLVQRKTLSVSVLLDAKRFMRADE
jgi:hypothetical protein